MYIKEVGIRKERERGREAGTLEDLGIGWSCTSNAYKGSITKARIMYNNACIVRYMPIPASSVSFLLSHSYGPNALCVSKYVWAEYVFQSLKWVTRTFKPSSSFKCLYAQLSCHSFVCIWCWHVSIKRHWDIIPLLTAYIHITMQCAYNYSWLMVANIL